MKKLITAGIIWQVVTVLAIAMESGTDAMRQEQGFKYALRHATVRLSMTMDALNYPEAPNRFEGICYRLGQFVESMDSVNTVLDVLNVDYSTTLYRQNFSGAKQQSQSTLKLFCGGLSAGNLNNKVQLQTSQQQEQWIKDMEQELLKIGLKIDALLNPPFMAVPSGTANQ